MVVPAAVSIVTSTELMKLEPFGLITGAAGVSPPNVVKWYVRIFVSVPSLIAHSPGAAGPVVVA
jgi:hypothetical protein